MAFCAILAQNHPQKINLSFDVFDADSNRIDRFNYSLTELNSGVKIYGNTEDIAVNKGTYSLVIDAETYIPFKTQEKLSSDTNIRIFLQVNVVDFNQGTVRAIQVRDKSGFTHTKLSAAQLSNSNLGQDFTYLIGNTASAVTTSDAGAGVGYTGIRIRGSDATRINVTINGIPINDAESHGVYWVNMPDLASSTSSVQIQRGVGSSTIGTGAFGANINIQNISLSDKPQLTMAQSYGSFNTAKSTLMFQTGQLGGFNFGGRLSRISSDGYVDRGASNLQAFQFNLNYKHKNFSASAVSFGGKEKTYQSWYGTPESRVNNDVAGMNAYADRNYLTDDQRANLLNSGRTYNYYTYANQTDNYWQNHYQLHLNYTFNPHLTLRTAFFTTTGKGYYEEYKDGAAFSSYRVPNFINGTDTITNTNLVRQRWLDNVFYGNFTSVNYSKGNTDLTGGVSVSSYHGKHFGKVIWAEIAAPFGLDNKYYQATGLKNEINTFIKWHQKVNKRLQLDVEAQYRHIAYSGKGIDNDGTQINFDTSYNFFNPKASLVYMIDRNSNVYASYSIGSREPIRSDFVDNPLGAVPKPEFLRDLEIGYVLKRKNTYYQFNFYSMDYKNQLVVTGELNDVGNALRRNVAVSYRRGVELIVNYPIMNKMSLDANLNLSANKIKNFEDYYYDYDSNSYKKDVYKLTDIAFSPSVVGYLGITDRHLRNLEISANVKHVGKQYMDNTLNNSAKLSSYTLLNFQINKTFSFKSGAKIIFKGMVNNITGIFYSNNGYTYKYVYGGNLTRENFYYPQSGRNFLLGVEFKFL